MKIFKSRSNRIAVNGTGVAMNTKLETSETVAGSQRSYRIATGGALLLSCALLGFASAGSIAQTAPAPTPAPVADAAPAPTPPGTVTMSGLLDIYYGINVRAPRAANGAPFAATLTPSGETISADNAGRTFDINDRDPSFSLGELNIVRTAGKGFPLDVHVTLTVGDSARIVHATEPGGTSSWQTLQQLYFTYNTKALKRPITIDFGTWVTHFGQEVIESSSNDEYSRSFGFQYAIPFYHTGIRVGLPINSKANLQFGVVNGCNNIADDNNAKSVFAQVSYNPTSTLNATFNYMGGSEGTGMYGAGVPTQQGNITTNFGEALLTWNPTAKLKLAGEADIVSAAGDVSGIHVNGNWAAYAAYARYQLKPNIALAARAEQFEDFSGVGGFGLRTGSPGYQKLNSGTLTFEYTSLRGHLVSRLEYRHDHSHTPFFGSANGNAVVDQDTFTLGEVYKF